MAPESASPEEETQQTMATDPSCPSEYGMLPYMCRRFERVGRTMSFRATTVQERRARRRRLRRKLKALTGYDTMERAPLKPRTTERLEDGDLVRERVEIQTEPGVVRNVKSQMAIARRACRLLGAPRAIRHDVFAGAHRWHGVEAVPWLARRMDARGR
jgi:hypothetical protein